MDNIETLTLVEKYSGDAMKSFTASFKNDRVEESLCNNNTNNKLYLSCTFPKQSLQGALHDKNNRNHKSVITRTVSLEEYTK